MSPTLKRYLQTAGLIWLIMVLVALCMGTIGGISDNIQYRDWFSVTMWAVFGPIGISASGAGIVLLIKSLARGLENEG
jgi:hypothetical protein